MSNWRRIFTPVFWRLFRLRREFRFRMWRASRRVEQGRWYVFRDEPTWLLLWLKSGAPNMDALEEKLEHIGVPEAMQPMYRRVHQQALIEFDLRMRPICEALQAAMKKAGLPPMIYEGFTPDNVADFGGQSAMLGYADPVEEMRGMAARIEAGEVGVHAEHVLINKDGEARSVSAQEFAENAAAPAVVEVENDKESDDATR
jgi:hypothetical protein